LQSSVPLAELHDVLDVGCNAGYNAIHLARKGASCVGIDVQQRHVDTGNFLAELAGVKAEFQIGHAENVLRQDGFDLVLHFGTLYHLPNPLNGLRAAWENLRSGGWFCLETHTYDDPENARVCYWLHGLNNDPSNFFALSTPIIRETLELVGFRDIVEVHRGATSAEHQFRICLVARKVEGRPLSERWPPWASD
jgi:SAM-dependent methyltransferase